MNEKSDVIQLVLMTIVDTVLLAQREKNMVGDLRDFTVQECSVLMENAIDRITKLLLPEVPAHCDLSPEMVKDFVRAFFATTHGTFENLLQNPFIMKVNKSYVRSPALCVLR